MPSDVDGGTPQLSNQAGERLASARLGRLEAFAEWFWRGAALGEATRRWVPVDVSLREYQRRALHAAEMGALMLEPPRPSINGSGEAFACELFRQTIHWCLLLSWQSRRLNPGASPSAELTANGASLASRIDFADLWSQADHELLLRAAGSAEQLQYLAQELPTASFVTFAECGSAELAELAQRLREFSGRLLRELSAPQRTLDRLHWQRCWRLSLVIAFMVATTLGVLFGQHWLERRNNLVAGKPWRASSHHMGGCASPAQRCRQSPGFFFHTALEDPAWIEFDLGQPRRFSAVRLLNRTDCCPARAVPLAIEAASTYGEWKELARQGEVFRSWKAEFSTTEARWLRIRSLRKTWLHLKEVRVLP